MEERKIGLTVLREALGYSIIEFAKELGVSRATLWKWTKDLPDIAQTKIRLKYKLPIDINLKEPLTEEQKNIIYQHVWNICKNGQPTSFIAKECIKELEMILKREQSVGWMAAMTAIKVRIQRDYSIEELSSYIENELSDYQKWWETKYSNNI